MTLKEHYFWTVSGPWTEKNEATDTEWKWKVEGKTLYLAFKGSTSKLDWKQNFMFWIAAVRQAYKKQPVKWFAHAGFMEKWKSVQGDVLEKILSEDIDRVVVSGFSQGGAVAILCHEDLWFKDDPWSVSTVTWGAPRVVWFWNWKKIAVRFKAVIMYRIRRDVVPKEPPKLFGYVDVGEVVPLGDPGISFPWQWEKIHMSYKGYMEV